MKLKYNIHIAVLFSLSVLHSCNDNKELTEDEKAMTYTVITKENTQNSAYIKENIKELLSQNKDSLSLKYDRLTADYIRYLETLESKIEKNYSFYFF